MFTLTPIKSSSVPALWSLVKEGVCVMISNKISGEFVTESRVYKKLVSAFMTLWIGREEDNYKGFLITQVNERGLLIYALYGCNGMLPDDLIEHGWGQLMKYAKETECREIYFYTKRKGMETRFKDFGFKPVQTVLSVEVQNG